ncbi:MAG: phospholipase D-like domain-containing protein [Marmoricola sp.]
MLRRRCTTISVLAALACLVTLLGVAPVATAADGAAATKHARKHQFHKKKAPKVTRTVGHPPANAAVRPGVVFNYPNRSRNEQTAIRRRVLNTIKSTWGGRRDRLHAAHSSNGTIRIATWTFRDMAMARALYAAHRRGVSVQVIAAKDPNNGSGPWRWLRKRLKTRLYHVGHRETANRWSFARTCRGSCRGRGGTPHSKYFLFHNVGSRHRSTITMQTSMNLTSMAYEGQWNEATTTWKSSVYHQFYDVFRESRLDRPVSDSYRHYTSGGFQTFFFPRPRTTAGYDPVMTALSHVHCTGHTKIRIVQYAIYDARGVWIAKRLRALWNAGCDIKIIFSAMNRPVFSILHARSGRGAVPMKQSVVRNGFGDIVKYNHNKWMAITGHWGTSTKAYLVFSGSSNWGNLAFSCDEQMQQIKSYAYTRPHLVAFGKTWRQSSSHAPRPGPIDPGARGVPQDLPETLTFGEGVYKYMTED